MSERLPSIAIVGGGMAAWMTAAALANAFKGRGHITVTETPQPASVAFDEGAIPTIRGFNTSLGIAEDDFIRETGAVFSLGTEFRGWAGADSAFFHPYGQIGTGIGSVGFHHCWFRLRKLGLADALGEYSLAAVAASLGRFARPAADASSVLSSYSYGFHFEAAKYTAMLRAYALARGVTVKSCKTVDAVLRGDDGFIDYLVLDKSEELQADLYVDCSGAFGALIERALRTGFEDWSHWLPCNRAIVCDSAGGTAPMTQIAARDAGWQWRIPMQHRTSHGLVYCSRFTDDWAARNALLGQIGAPPAAEPVLAQFTNGRRKKLWNKNCVAIGEAAVFLEPLESTSVHLVQSGIARLLQLLPAGRFDPAVADEYNRLTTAEFEGIRDFLVLHYCANNAGPSPLWEYCRTMSVPDSLAYKIEMFRSRGRVPLHAEEVFYLPAWLSVLVGLGIEPLRHHPFADGIELETLKKQTRLIRTVVRQAAESLPRAGVL
jgi:tryptophan halogenase